MPVVAILPAAVVSALCALAFLLAYGKFRDAIHENLHFNIGVGPFSFDLFGPVVGGVDYLYAVTLAVFDAWVRPLEDFILKPIAAIEANFDAIKNAIGQTAAAVYQLQLQTLPAITGAIEAASGDGAGYVLQQFHVLADSVANSVKDEETWVSGYITSALAGYVQIALNAEQYALDVLDTWGGGAADVVGIATGIAETQAGIIYNRVEADISTAIADAQTYAGTLFGDTENDIASALAQAEAFTRTALLGVVGLSVTDIDNAIATGLATIATDIDVAVTGAIGVIGTDLPDIAAALKAIPISFPLDLAGIAALAGATTLAMSRYLEECGIPNCRNLSKYGSDLQSMLALGNDSEFISLIVGLVHNPGGAFSAVESEFGSIIYGAAGAAKALFS